MLAINKAQNTYNELVRDILLAVMAYQAKAEAERISDRTKAGIVTYRRKHADKWGATPIERSKPALYNRIEASLKAGTGIGKTARELGVGVGTVHRIAKELRGRTECRTLLGTTHGQKVLARTQRLEYTNRAAVNRDLGFRVPRRA